ncbi:DUF5694 domain-containing protein [Sphingomonas sp.]|uniref:DUF5694 domain-containing protein n=1 Tax=Sphingomonas sp. TaxID=28214 RepID=UPI002611A9F6|nr:DUF5694 domain-containing protein [Sphingomonas sp.]MDF2495444.1 hypothetical protein [Sphingomonas sp.]
MMGHLLSRTLGATLALVGLSGGVAVAAGAAPEYRPAFRPEQLKGPPTGTPNDVLVLGTTHLSGMDDNFRPAMLAPLLDRLARWKPTAITVEALSGLQCDSLRRYPVRYASTVEDYCRDPGPAGRAIGLDVPAANAEAEKLLAAWPAAPTPAQRRRLAAVFLAAGESASALVQWLRLPEAERRAGDGLTADLAASLNQLKDRRNENSLIAAVLAARLEHERLWSVDDHSADGPLGADQVAAEAAVMRAWDNPATKARLDEDKRLQAGLSQPDGILKMYRSMNDPQTPMQVYRSDFGAALAEPSPGGYGRRYVGSWETRNLRMVANIRDVLAHHPGSRLLAIVGASHKGYFDAYLNQMHDVRLADASLVLR